MLRYVTFCGVSVATSSVSGMGLVRSSAMALGRGVTLLADIAKIRSGETLSIDITHGDWVFVN